MFRRLGFQKRIMGYVVVGLALMLGVFAYLGIRAVQQGTELVFEERLAIAQSVAAAMSRDFEHVIRDTTEDTASLSLDKERAELQAIVLESFLHTAKVDVFSFFTIASVWLLDQGGRLLAAAPADSVVGDDELPLDIFAQVSASGGEARIFWPEEVKAGQFVSMSLPQQDAQGDTWGWVVVNTEAASTPQPFVPFGLLGLAPDDHQTSELPQQAHYHLEVLTPAGTILLSIGTDLVAGELSSHYPLIQSLIERGETTVVQHQARGSGGTSDHVMAVVPVPPSELYLILEQDSDVALALFNTLRRQLILYGSLGFVATLLVAWVTTRHVVKPAEELTKAAVRMARGELATPIRIRAQDELGVLSENLELMRQQLKHALDEVEAANRELESRVKERTQQLQVLVQRVFRAQEEERHRIALELHDETAQALAALTVELDSVMRKASHLTTEELARLRAAYEMTTNTLEGLRRLINALRPVALKDMGLAVALRWYAQEQLERVGVQIHVADERARAEVREQAELTLFRIGQEALNNVARHARASNVWITIADEKSLVSLAVRDDGVGFDPASVTTAEPQTRGVGLAGMVERADLAGGRLTVDSTPGKGTTVRVEVPLPSHD